jgi:hypothetical protein
LAFVRDLAQARAGAADPLRRQLEDRQRALSDALSLPTPDSGTVGALVISINAAQTQVGQVVALMIAPHAAADPLACTSVTARPGGIDGDRYQDGTGTFSTSPPRRPRHHLIEAEALDELAARGVSISLNKPGAMS